jgi:predicted alpha/beta superfamily hydrolase
MKNIFFILIAAVFLAGCESKNGTGPGEEQGHQYIIGKMDSLHSDILDETRNIWVHVPGGRQDDIFAQANYPVLYLLDGPDHFHAVTGILGQLSGNSISPALVVVSIPNTDRTRDLTPTHVDVAFGDSTFARTSGGGDEFLAFMGKELIPYIESKYPVTGYRTFVGHSFGGLLVIHALYKHSQLFDNYVAIDPSLWWDDGILLRTTDSVLKNTDLSEKALYVGVANTMEEGMVVEEVRNDTAQSSNHIRSILNFLDMAGSDNASGLTLGWNYYKDDDHGSVPLITEYDALRFLFSWYRLEGLNKFFPPDSELTAEDLIAHLSTHYEKVSEHFGYKVLPPESTVNSLGYNFMQMKPDFAFAMFDLNLRNYPESANVFDSMGDYYLAQSDTLKAQEHFKKAFDMGESPITKEKLDALE